MRPIHRLLLRPSLPLIYLSLVLLTSLSCAGAPRRLSFDAAAYAPYAQAGTSTVEGRASVQDETGAWHVAAGRDILLQPVTPYAQEWFDRVVLGDEELEPGDPALVAFVHSVKADDSGAFRFTQLPPGEYFLTCRITWVTAGLQSRILTSGAWAHARVTVPAETTVNLLLGR